MGVVIFWLDEALEKLDEIFDYYKNTASVGVARNVVTSIVDATINLENQPKIG